MSLRRTFLTSGRSFPMYACICDQRPIVVVDDFHWRTEFGRRRSINCEHPLSLGVRTAHGSIRGSLSLNDSRHYLRLSRDVRCLFQSTFITGASSSSNTAKRVLNENGRGISHCFLTIAISYLGLTSQYRRTCMYHLRGRYCSTCDCEANLGNFLCR